MARQRKDPRRVPPDDAERSWSVSMKPSLVARIDGIADTLEISRSEVIRQALAEFLISHPEHEAAQEALVA